MAYIGLREVDPLERSILDRLRIPSYSMMEIDELGIREVRTSASILTKPIRCFLKLFYFGQCLRRALRAINPDSQRPLHVSFDIDALDPLEAPSTGTPGTSSLKVGSKNKMLKH